MGYLPGTPAQDMRDFQASASLPGPCRAPAAVLTPAPLLRPAARACAAACTGRRPCLARVRTCCALLGGRYRGAEPPAKVPPRWPQGAQGMALGPQSLPLLPCDAFRCAFMGDYRSFKCVRPVAVLFSRRLPSLQAHELPSVPSLAALHGPCHLRPHQQHARAPSAGRPLSLPTTSTCGRCSCACRCLPSSWLVRWAAGGPGRA